MRWTTEVFPIGTSIVPQGVSYTPDAHRGTTLSYIMCPIIADALGHPEWYPAEYCVRPEGRMGAVFDTTLVPGVWKLDPSAGPTWDQVVTAVRQRLERVEDVELGSGLS